MAKVMADINGAGHYCRRAKPKKVQKAQEGPESPRRSRKAKSRKAKPRGSRPSQAQNDWGKHYTARRPTQPDVDGD